MSRLGCAQPNGCPGERRLHRPDAVLIGVGTFIVVTAVVGSLLPTVNEVSAGFPATVLWHSRIASLGTQAYQCNRRASQRSTASPWSRWNCRTVGSPGAGGRRLMS
ncbi:CbtA family protein [Actinopolymorpha pittospori]